MAADHVLASSLGMYLGGLGKSIRSVGGLRSSSDVVSALLLTIRSNGSFVAMFQSFQWFAIFGAGCLQEHRVKLPQWPFMNHRCAKNARYVAINIRAR